MLQRKRSAFRFSAAGLLIAVMAGAIASFQNCGPALQRSGQPTSHALESGTDLTTGTVAFGDAVQRLDAPLLPEHLKFFGFFNLSAPGFAVRSGEEETRWFPLIPRRMNAVSGFSNMLWFSYKPEWLLEARRKNRKIILDISSRFLGESAQPPGGGAPVFYNGRLRSDRRALWTETVQFIRNNGLTDQIEAFYILDEPYMNLCAWNDLTENGVPRTPPRAQQEIYRDCRLSEEKARLEEIISTVKADFPAIPTAMIFSGPEVFHISTGRMQIPAGVDWVSVDCYGDWNNCPAGGIPGPFGTAGSASSSHSIPAYLDVLKSHLSASQRLLLVPDAFLGPQGDANALVERIARYVDYAFREPKVIGIVPFIYQDFEETGIHHTGTQNIPQALARYVEIGNRVINGGTPEFSASAYREIHSDLQSAFGTSEELFRLHWRNTGLREGRRASLVLDLSFYLTFHIDVAQGAGSHPQALAHWQQHGQGEGRRPSAEFDPALYLEFNPDVTTGFGSTPFAAMKHWLHFGLTEGRRTSEAFDVADYLARHPDLRAEFGATGYSAAWAHWIRAGLPLEGRRPSLEFDPRFYLANNPDVAAALGGSNFTGALHHWLRTGIDECRAGSADVDLRAYQQRYSEIRAATAGNCRAALTEWLRTGKRAGRDAHPIPPEVTPAPNACTTPVSNERYLELYGDVRSAGGNTLAVARSHFENYGRAEGRCPLERVIFDAQAYLDANSDVAAWAERNHPSDPHFAARQHFCENVVHRNEFRPLRTGTPAIVFDSHAYLAANPDVHSSGMSAQAHLCGPTSPTLFVPALAYGLNEGRLLR